jgi:hypothetical protein
MLGLWGGKDMTDDYYAKLKLNQNLINISKNQNPAYFSTNLGTVNPFNTFNKEEVEMSIVNKIKELAKSKDDKLLAKHVIVDNCGNLTCEGRDVLQNILFEEYKAKIVAKVKLVDDEEKKAKKK